MKELNLTLPRDARPRYLRIADALRAAIQDGRVQAGEPLPSARTLARELGAHRQTVMAALGELVAEGWVSSQERREYRVSDTLPSAFFGAETTPAQAPRAPFAWRFARGEDADAPVPPAPETYAYPFLSGTADLRVFPVDEFRGFLNESLRRVPGKVLAFGEPSGHAPFKKEVAVYLRRMRGIKDREIVVTNGSQEAIFLIAQLLVAPGDKVGVEEHGYRPAWEALRAAGAELVPLPVDGDGLDADAAAAVMRRSKLKLIYITPLHQYPTTVTMPVGRRARLYEACVRHGVPLLEDDYDHEFHYRCQPLAPMAANDPAGLVLYVSTFSKVLFPSARLGFAALPPEIGGRLSVLKRITSRQNDALLQDAVARWMRDGGFERHLRRMRRHYEERRDAVAGALERGRAQGLPLDWKTPDGGLALWVDVGCDADLVVARAAERGVYAVSGSAFRLSRRDSSRYIRLGYPNQTPRELALGMKRLFEAIACSVS